MFQFESDAENVFLNLQRDLLYADEQRGENLRRGAVEALAIIANRVQQKGENASGQRLVTKARLRSGAYSKAYAKRRAERGRQIDHIDFTNEGDLMRSFQVLTSTPDEATVGFLDNRQADKAEYLEDYFGETFELSSAEQDFVVEGLVERTLDDLRLR